SFPLNRPNGGVSVTGLPGSGWTPGQSYPLSITITGPATQRLFGFQLSAVADSTNQQAGTFAETPNVQVICGRGVPLTSIQTSCAAAGAIQYAEHRDARIVTRTYTVTWTAPTDVALGTIRFNVAGNAANGDNTSAGDLIYTNVYRIAA